MRFEIRESHRRACFERTMQTRPKMIGETDHIREAIGRRSKIGRRRNEHRAIRREPIVQRDGRRSASHRMSDHRRSATEMTTDRSGAAREFRQCRRLAGTAAVAGLIERDDRKTRSAKRAHER